jgi:hypothetical protein
MVIDPFAAHLSKLHPKRLALKAAEIITGEAAKRLFNRSFIPYRPGEAPTPDDAAVSDGLSTTAAQRALLVHIARARATFPVPGTIVELGCWEGQTTRLLGKISRGAVVGVDRYFEGWPRAAGALSEFQKNTRDLPNVRLLRASSVAAARAYEGEKIGMIFVDAQHTFINCLADFYAWKPHLLANAHVVFHDVDNTGCPGVRAATNIIARNMRVEYHINNMLVLRFAAID